MNPGNPTMPVQPVNPETVIIQTSTSSADDGPGPGDYGHVRPPRPKK